MQPVTYSLILNMAALAVTGALAYFFNEPLLVVVALVLQTHVMERFNNAGGVGAHPDDEDDEDEDQPMGFTADIKGK